ncbi:hypothetical protein ACE3NQ_20230 [Paenibacillus terreus]|uniref:Uncharacterized protein n=1 Tax=Paenibacillus terreus TaxID=1387834 RepID=A0ABV5BC20_9BACL
MTEAILDEDGEPYFMLIHQARTADGVPEKVKELLEKYSMEIFVEQMRPLFIEGQRAGEIAADDPDELIACYLSVLNGLMILNVQELGGYQVPQVAPNMPRNAPHLKNEHRIKNLNPRI